MSLGGQKEAEAWIFIDRDPGFGDGLPWNCTGPSRGGRFLPGNIDRLDRAGASDTVPSVSPASRPYRSHLKVPVSLVPSGPVIPFAAARGSAHEPDGPMCRDARLPCMLVSEIKLHFSAK